MRRREFIGGLAGVAAWPLAARAQQGAAPVVGFLHLNSAGSATDAAVAAFRRGLGETGYVVGRNVAVEYRWAEGQFDRLPALTADLIRRQVSVIFTASPTAVELVKKQPAAIPVVFLVGEDPVKAGLVNSLSRPGVNATGFSVFNNQLFAKRVELLRQAAPAAGALAFLVNSTNPNADADTKEVQAAAKALGWRLVVLAANSESQIELAFGTMLQQGAGALVVGVDPFLISRREKLTALAAHHGILTMYSNRIFVTAGGLMSYDSDNTDIYRQSGVYVGRILKGEKAGDLPVQQSTKVELIINLKTAKALGLTIPETLLATADEVIQ